jgi:hypothetical protein
LNLRNPSKCHLSLLLERLRVRSSSGQDVFASALVVGQYRGQDVKRMNFLIPTLFRKPDGDGKNGSSVIG